MPAPGFSSGQAIAAMERLSENLPRGFGHEWTGLAFQEKLAGGQTVYIFAFSVLFVFLVLAALVRELGHPPRGAAGAADRRLRRPSRVSGSAGSPTTCTCRSAS